jgi:hypothetical protein
MPTEEESLRLEFEVWRIGGDDEAEGITLPRRFEPEVFAMAGLEPQPGTLISTTVESAGPDRFRIRLVLRFGRFGPAPRPDWHAGELTLYEEGGTEIGAAPFTFYGLAGEMAVQTIVWDRTDRQERTGADLGTFLVMIRVPGPDEWTYKGGRMQRLAPGVHYVSKDGEV